MGRNVWRYHAHTSVAVLALIIGNVGALYFAGHPIQRYLTQNADLLYLPALFSDLSKGGRLSDWFLTPAPYFFPDYPVYFVAHTLGFNAFTRIALFASAQALVTFAALWLLARRVIPAQALLVAVTITCSLIWFAVSAGEPFVILFASASHYGTYVSSILLVALWLEYRKSAGRRRRVLLGAICGLAFASALSDNLFLIQALVPFVATAIAMTADEGTPSNMRGRSLWIAAWVFLAFAIPVLTYRVPIDAPVVNVAWADAVDEQQRASLEGSFHLTDGDFRGGQLWTYRIVDTSRANVTALVRHPGVEDTEHIDRIAFTVDGASGPLRRSAQTLPIGLAASTFAVLGLVFMGRIWRHIRQRVSITNDVRLLIPLLFGALGYLSYNVLVANPTRYPPSFGLEKAYTNTSAFYDALLRMARDQFAFGVLLLGYVGLLMFWGYGWIRKRDGDDDSRPMVWVGIFSLVSILSTLVTATLMTDLPVMPRYLIPVFSWPVAIVGLGVAHYLRQRFLTVGIALSAAAVVVLSVDSYRLASVNRLDTDFYTSELACIDAALENAGVSNGIAQYWDAKFVQQFSRRDLSIAPHLGDLEQEQWITSKRAFRDAYDFAIVDEQAEPAYRISADALMRINGPPARTVPCGSKSIHIYGKDKLRTTAKSVS